MLTGRREAIRASIGYHLLVTIYSVFDIWAVKLHQYGGSIQSKTGIGAERLEDANCLYRSLHVHCCNLYLVSFHKCGETVDAFVTSS